MDENRYENWSDAMLVEELIMLEGKLLVAQRKRSSHASIVKLMDNLRQAILDVRAEQKARWDKQSRLL